MADTDERPSTLESRSESPSWLDTAIERLRLAVPYLSLDLGEPPAGEDGWQPFEAYREPGPRTATIERLWALDPSLPPVEAERTQANYLFRNLTYGPLILAGYLLAAERRVPALAGHVLSRDVEWMWTHRLVTPRAWVLPDDPIAGDAGVNSGIEVCADLDALTERFWVEVQALCGPFVESFVAAKYLARANGWGTVLDAVAIGFTAAGRSQDSPDGDDGLDEAWAGYGAAISGREFPVRRRPRRLAFDAGGRVVDTYVRAGCCMWFTTEAARCDPAGPQFCGNCYLWPSDEARIASLRRAYGVSE